MDELALEVGRIVIGLAILYAILWIVGRSPFLFWLGKVVLLIGWGVFVVGIVLFVVFTIYLPQERYWQAILGTAVGAVLYVPWFAFGLPEIRKSFKKGNIETTIWR